MPGWALDWLRPLLALVASPAEACLEKPVCWSWCLLQLPPQMAVERGQILAGRALGSVWGCLISLSTTSPWWFMNGSA